MGIKRQRSLKTKYIQYIEQWYSQMAEIYYDDPPLQVSSMQDNVSSLV